MELTLMDDKAIANSANEKAKLYKNVWGDQ